MEPPRSGADRSPRSWDDRRNARARRPPCIAITGGQPMVTYKSLHDHAVVSFTGDGRLGVDLPAHRPRRHAGRAPLPHPRRAGHRLAGAGVVAALDHYLECTGRWRGAGGAAAHPGGLPTPSAQRRSCSRSATSAWPSAGRGCSTTRRGSTTRGPITARREHGDARCAAPHRRRHGHAAGRAGCSTAGASVRVPYGAEPSDRRVLDALAADVAVRPGEKPPRRLGGTGAPGSGRR